MNPSGSQTPQEGDNWGGWRGGEPGTRRRKLAGYLKAANELRQTYQQSYLQNFASSNAGQGDEYGSMPGSYPQAVARNGEEEMIIFPSYARRHIRDPPKRPSRAHSRVSSSSSLNDADFWKEQWDKQEADNAIVDVDVRGWVYTPHKGPMTRRHRLFIGLARQLVGIPAPSTKSPSGSAGSSRASSPHGFRERLASVEDKREADIVAKEAEAITRRGEEEARAAGEGQYYEKPGRDPERVGSSTPHSPSFGPADKREGNPPSLSWSDPAKMSPEELHTANKHLMRRLKPFLANPAATIPISAFFYNEDQSRQRTIETDAAGHFSVRAALDFVPTHVRVLASENLSATEEVLITEPSGVSVISDIDDTIKHSAISSGAREIFRNVFVREFRELHISGVKEWYKQLADKGVSFHYVSNSPWQLYPALVEFFSMAGLPPGSFHLKQYTGMFQGIFEPVAERKKATLEKILRDFPERQFLLVGDSGEADLEVYRDVVKENPGRVLGVFIRDVTTKYKRGFFDPAAGPLSAERFRRTQSGSSLKTLGTASPAMSPRMNPSDFNDPDLKEALARSLQDLNLDSDRAEHRPRLPPRRPPMPSDSADENLIDLDSPTGDTPPMMKRSQTDTPAEVAAKIPPKRPSKPANLSSKRMETARSDAAPGRAGSSRDPPLQPSRHESKPDPERKSVPPPPPPRRTTYRERLTNVYNRLSPPSSPRLGAKRDVRREMEGLSLDTRMDTESSEESTPNLPPRKQMSYPAMAGQAINQMYNSAMPTSEDESSMAYGWPDTVLDKKEEMWKRRWVQVKTYLDSKNVMLRAWRVGEDVSNDALRLIEKARKDQAHGRHDVRR